MALQANRRKQWQRIVEAGLCPEISDFETYEAKATEQLGLAYRAVIDRSIAVPSPADVAAVHTIIFDGIHPWAGEFRKMGETVRFDRGVVGLDAHRIVPELERIALETKNAIDRSTSPQDIAMAIACFHARYRRAHPFLDGNTRTSAVLLEAQLQTLFPGETRRIQERPEDYKLKLAQAYRGDLAPLTNHILAVTGHSLIEAIDVKMPTPMFDDDLETEIIKHRERIIAEQKGQQRRTRL
jgi:hypothetical protein